MKPFKYLLFGIILLSVACDSKNITLTITDVKTMPDTFYDRFAKGLLGKKVNLVFFDNSVKVTREGKEPEILRLYPSGEYIGKIGTMTVTKSYGAISEITISGLDHNPVLEPPFLIEVSVTAKK